MMPTFLRRSCLLVASLALAATFRPCMAAERTAEEWSELLASDSPAVRQEAAAALLAEGGAAEPVIEQLMRSPNPWMAARAGRLLMRARGIDPRLPLDLQQAVSDFPKQPLPEQYQILGRLTIRQPGALETLVLLHSRSAPSAEDDQRI